MSFALLHKFPHWSEVLSVLTYSTEKDSEFVFYKRGETYQDPLGNLHTIYPKGHFSKEDVMIFNGSIHLETHPLSVGKIPYSCLPYKIGIEHTTGYSPWDYLQMVDLAEISASGSSDAQGSKVVFAMNHKFYHRFMETPWEEYKKDYYEVYKEKINRLVDQGYIVPTLMEPAQYWIEEVPPYLGEVSPNICICLNWCNLNKVVKVQQVVEICKKLHDYTGKSIDIRLHSYSREGLFHILEELPYVNLIPYLSMSKYEVMDKYELYFVDGTGLGYEIAGRCKIRRRNVNIFYLNGLSSDDSHGGFDGIVEMGATPLHDHLEFLSGETCSNYSDRVVEESFPHTSSVPDEVRQQFVKISEKVKSL